MAESTHKGSTCLLYTSYDGLPKAQNGVGDPAIWVDKKTGTIWIVAAGTHGMGNGRAWGNSQTGMDRNHTAVSYTHLNPALYCNRPKSAFSILPVNGQLRDVYKRQVFARALANIRWYG